MKSLIRFFGLLLLTSVSFAQDKTTSSAAAIKNEPPADNGYPYFLTNSIYPLDQGILEIIVIPFSAYNPFSRNHVFLPTFNYGITDSWQIFYSVIPYQIHLDPTLGEVSGMGDMDIGTEYSWMYIKKSNLSAALYLDIHLPTGDIDKNLTDGLIYYTPALMLAQDFVHSDSRTQIFMEFSMSFVQRVKTPQNPELLLPTSHYFELNGGVAERTEKLNFSIEINWFTNEWNNNGSDNEVYITPGFYWYLKKDIALGIGVPIGLTNASYNYMILGNLLVDIDVNAHHKNTAEDKDGDGNSDRPLIQKKRLYDHASTEQKLRKQVRALHFSH